MCCLWSWVFPGTFALLTLTVPAQVLAAAWRSVAEVAAFYPIPQFSRWFCGLSVLFTGFFALALVFLGCTCGVAFSLRMPLLRLGHRLR